jgi:hypothetical protein
VKRTGHSLRGALSRAAVLLVSSCALVVSFDDREREPRSLHGTVFGLTDGAVSLRLGMNVEEVGNGPFSFPAILAYGSVYSLTVAAQPVAQHCSIRGGEGDVGGADIVGIEVRCQPKASPECDAGNDAGGNAGPPPCP